VFNVPHAILTCQYKRILHGPENCNAQHKLTTTKEQTIV
jgi:hypothetical protein